MKDTLCLYVGYDKFGKVDDYVVDAVKRYSKFCDVYYLADCDLDKSGGVSRLKSYTKFADAYRHGKYDFGSWSELFKKIGWKNVEKYKRLILVNDSCYGPFYDIEKLCTTDFDKSPYDFYGYTMNKNKSKRKRHIQSFFFILKHNVFSNKEFQKFFDNVKHLDSKNEIITRYENGLSQLLINQGFKYGKFIKKSTAYYPKKIMKQNGFLLKTSFFYKVPT
ncbi:MAG: rhamnan synthesis F family protein [bacterium]|nr:rhamnan synthesis F family protein [bacterium]